MLLFVVVASVVFGVGGGELELRLLGDEGGDWGEGGGSVERGREERKVRCVRTSWLVRVADWVSRICVDGGGVSEMALKDFGWEGGRG